MDAQTQRICTPATVETPRWAAVRGLARLTTYVQGKEILILGPGAAGKTKFAQYLRLGALDLEENREMTYAVTGSPAFVLGFGQEQGLVLKVRRAVDTPGQVGPLQHALLVGRRRPHAVIVVLDCTGAALATIRWLCLFCNALDTVLRKGSFVAKRLQEIVVLLNKRDKITAAECAQLKQAARQVLRRYLSVALGKERVNAILIQECISVRTGHGTALIDGVIAQLSERLAGRPELCPAAPDPELAVLPPASPQLDPLRPSCRPAAPPPPPPPPPRQPAPARPAGKFGVTTRWEFKGGWGVSP